MAKDETGRLSGYGTHKDKRLKREANLLRRLYDEETDDTDTLSDSERTTDGPAR